MTGSSERRRTLIELLDVVRTSAIYESPVLVTVDELPQGPAAEGELTMQTASGGPFNCADHYTRQYGHNDTIEIKLPPGGSDAVTLQIGRSRTAHVRLIDESVSSQHARLLVDRRHFEYLLTDTSSRNGTYINGERLPTESPRALWAGAFVSFGAAVYVFLDPPTLRKLVIFPSKAWPAISKATRSPIFQPSCSAKRSSTERSGVAGVRPFQNSPAVTLLSSRRVAAVDRLNSRSARRLASWSSA